MKKLVILLYFGRMSWLEEYKKNISVLKEYGYDWLIFTDKKEFEKLVLKNLGIKCNWGECPIKPCDFAPAFGLIFEDYLKGYDWWAYTNFDIVFGRIDKFIPDRRLEKLDIVSFDDKAMNGMFSMMRNCKEVNNLFKQQDGWQKIMSDKEYHNFDEYGFEIKHQEEHGFSGVVRRAMKNGRIRAEFHFWHCHDGLPAHNPPKIKIEKDGSLICETCKDEIVMFHFNKNRKKKYPKIKKL